MPELDVEADPFLKLLTDALRAGPGSPQWHEAVSRLRSGDGSEADPKLDEYQLLLRAREDLANGRQYREVRAGTGFTHKLLVNLDKEKAGKARSIPTATIVAIVAAIAVLAVLSVVAWQLAEHGEVNRGAVDDLASTYFPNESAVSLDKDLPAGWKPIGKLPLVTSGGLRAGSGADLLGGGLVAETPLPATQSFAFEADLHAPRPNDHVIAQVFISTSGDFSADRGASSHELVWQLVGEDQQVVLNGNTEPATPAPGASVLRIRLTMNHDLAVVEANGKRVWAGPHQLGDGLRYPGVRFIRKSPGETGPVVVSMKLLK